MKKYLRFTAFFLALSLLAALIAGCGAGSAPAASAANSAKASVEAETPAPAEEPSEPAPAQDTPAPESSAVESDVEELPEIKTISYPLSEETVTLSLFFSVAPILADLIGSMNDITAYDIAEQVTNVHLDATISTPETTGEKFQVMIASGSYTDLIHNVGMQYAGGLDKAVDDEVLIDLSEYLADYAPNYSAFLDSNETAKKQYTTEAGRMAAIQGLSYSFVQGPVIREDWLTDCGLEVPETIDQLETVLTAFKNEKGARNSILFTIGNIYLAGSFNLGDGTADGTEGATYNVVDGKVEMSYFDQDYYPYIETLAKWNAAGLFSSDFISLFGAGVADSFALSDDCGFWYGAQDTLGSTYAARYAGESDHFNTIAIPLVTWKEGATVDTGTMLGTMGEAWSVTTNCTQPEIAVSYLDWFFTEEGTEICNYGIEGESFTYDDDGNAVYTDLIVNNPDGLSQMQAQWLYTNFQAPYVQDTNRNNSLYADEVQRTALSIWDSNRTDNKKYYGSLTTEEAEVYNTYASDLETYAGEQLLRFILNEEPLNETSWATFISTLESMHAADMVSIKQTAYDRYLSK